VSMNLIFTVKDCSIASVEFPFQTPTDLTYCVLNAKSMEEKLELIKNCLIQWDTEEQRINEILAEVESLLLNDKLELSMI